MNQDRTRWPFGAWGRARPTFLHLPGLVLLVAYASLLGGCDILSTECSTGDIPSDQAHRVTISQGAWGQVWVWKGNFSPRCGCGGGKVRPVERLIMIHEVALWPDDVVLSDPPQGQSFFREVHSPLVDSVRSDAAGFFEMALPAGRYSLFVREDSHFYARNWAPNRPIGLVEVPEDGVPRVQIDINYQAAF